MQNVISTRPYFMKFFL